jgi:uncharacterized membrane protein
MHRAIGVRGPELTGPAPGRRPEDLEDGHMPGMSIVEKSIDIQAPVSTVYNQWTQFEDFPKFMEGVREVEQVSEERLRWRSVVGGQEREWDVAIVEQTPDTRIAWRSGNNAVESGIVNFAPIYGGTRVTMQMTYDPDELAEQTGETEEQMTRRVEGNLQRFKEFIEARGAETGAWRGEIHGGQVVHDVHHGQVVHDVHPGQVVQEARAADADQPAPHTP